MSKNIIWSHELRIKLYEQILLKYGKCKINYDGSVEGFSKRGKPNHLSKKEWLSDLDVIAKNLGLGESKGGALSNQIAWIFANVTKGCHQGHANNLARNTIAAIEGGWLVYQTYMKEKGKVVETPSDEPMVVNDKITIDIPQWSYWAIACVFFAMFSVAVL